MSDPVVISFGVVGDKQVTARLRELSTSARSRVSMQIERLGLELLTIVNRDYLTGQALHVRSGRLRRSINEQTTEHGESITTSVGTNVSYGRLWELGFTREYIKHKINRKTGYREEIRRRKITFPARPFLTPALADMKPRILAQLAKVSTRMVRDGA